DCGPRRWTTASTRDCRFRRHFERYIAIEYGVIMESRFTLDPAPMERRPTCTVQPCPRLSGKTGSGAWLILVVETLPLEGELSTPRRRSTSAWTWFQSSSNTIPKGLRDLVS